MNNKNIEKLLKDNPKALHIFIVSNPIFELISLMWIDFNKIPMGWEEVLFNAGAATNDTIVNAWARYTAADIVATGHRTVESKSSAFYFTEAARGGPSGWKKCWYDIATNVTEEQKPLLLGGEMSTSCRISQY